MVAERIEHFEEHVFVNQGCAFLGQGGIHPGNGVLIGRGAVVGAGATVTKEVPRHAGDRTGRGRARALERLNPKAGADGAGHVARGAAASAAPFGGHAGDRRQPAILTVVCERHQNG
ncbi:hypothetical protein GCM10018963_55440 [Saccharothrix longispora]